MKFQQKQQVEREQKKLDMLGTTNRPIGKLLASSGEDAKVLASSLGGGKVRQMFEERRSVGIDKSYPLKPISGNTERSTTRLNSEPLINGRVKPGLAKPQINSVARASVVKNDNEFKTSSPAQLDRDPLNNTIVIPKYNSTNRVPSLKSHNNNNNTVAAKLVTSKPATAMQSLSAEVNKPRKVNIYRLVAINCIL